MQARDKNMLELEAFSAVHRLDHYRCVGGMANVPTAF